MFCQNCGTKLDDGTVFCPNCGTKTEAENAAATQNSYTNAGSGASTNEAYSFAQPNTNAGASAATGATITDEEQLENAFITGNPSGNAGIGNSFLHYKKSFAAFRAGKSVQWNWASCLLNAYNMAYRKLYSLAIVFTFAGAILSVLSASYIITPGLALILSIAMLIITGCIADKSLYNKFTAQKNIAISSFPNDIEQQKVYMSQNGGTKISAVWLFIGLYVVASAGMKFLFG